MRRREHQSGFSTTVILLFVLVVTALIATSIVVYQHHKPNNAKNSAATGSSQPTGQQQGTTTTQPSQATTKYLDFKEWGVKMPLSSTINTAYYKVGEGSSEGPGGLPTTMWLGLASLSSASCNPSNNEKGQRGAIGAILRVSPTETDPVSNQPLTKKYPNGATIGGHYYAYQSWAKNSPCASDSTLQPVDSAFATAANGIVSDTTN